LHTNGYSLARNVLLSKYKLDDEISDLGSDLKTELLRVHKSYLSLIQRLISNISIKGFSHITGGGIIGNTKRIIPDKLKIELDWTAWEIPSIFKLIQETGKINDEEMRKVFNMGIGLIAVIAKNDLQNVINVAEQLNEEVILIGKIV
jgi:phosphoribosylformylglycinamidine cyclo-ligase